MTQGGVAGGGELIQACDACLVRPWLLRELSGHLDPVRADVLELLTLDNDQLLAAVGGRRRDHLAQRLVDLDATALRRDAGRAGLELICRCDAAYPARLRDLRRPPDVLHIAGGAERFLAAARSDPVAIVGSRAASPYGTSVARSLARGLAAAGVPVISGMAMGIDSAAHQGALEGSEREPPAREWSCYRAAPTIAILPGPANEPYPRGARALYRRLLKTGSAISELAPRAPARGWTFLARNRIIAALAAMTIVVEAGERSAALLTARCAAELGRIAGAVPGRVTAPQARGPNRLIKEGAHVVSNPQDVLDLLFEAGTRTAPEDDRPGLTRELRTLLSAIEEGHDTPAALARQGILAQQGLAALASLELAGYVERGAGGRFTVVP